MYDIYGQQREPHKYIDRKKKNRKWIYKYPSQSLAVTDDNSLGDKAITTTTYKVVIAHGKPTPIVVDTATSRIVDGPPQVVGKVLFININPKKSYFGIARSLETGYSVYLYPETILERASAKKAAKFLRASRALDLIDKEAEDLMRSKDIVNIQYGLAMWLNNNTKLRIGAHESAASVDPKERAAIIAKAKRENWTEKEKLMALQQIRRPTFGLLTTRVGHLKIDHANRIVSWRFRGKGGKMITEENVSQRLEPLQYNAILALTFGKKPEDKLFPDVNYKRIWRFYRKFGVTPHVARGKFANEMVSQIIKDFTYKKDETPRQALARLKKEIETKVSIPLGHTENMTERAYLSDVVKKGLEEIRHQQQLLQESDNMGYLKELAECLIWTEVPVGSVIV